jgi:biopolymer transport protein ExbD
MPRHKIKRKTPSLDMTPMVDLAFLLVTFFMLTTQFRPEEPVTVQMPTSIDSVPLPEGVITLTVAKDGRVFFDMSNKFHAREDLIRRMNEEYKMQLSDPEIKTFSNLTTFGMPVDKVKGWLDTPPSQRSKYPQPGIPHDSTNNELRRWILNARFSNPSANVAVKGDGDAAYKVVRSVMKTIQGEEPYKLNKFYLLTNAEANPNAKPH